MKLTLDWLRDFVDLPLDDPAEIASALDSLGLEVEAWEPIAHTFRDVVIGRVLGVAPHPNADKVRLTVVDVGGGETLDIVCGAWNFAAGAVVPVAVPGAMLPDDFEISTREIRGVVSSGMICSELELKLGEDGDGIMVLDDDYPEAADRIGEDFASLLPAGDAWYDLAITPNRPDAMSVYGVALDLAAYFAVPVRHPAVAVTGAGAKATTSITIEDPVACPRFAGREVRGITIGPSPHWMRYRLALAGVRPISNVVDASNYAMIELGHPTHAFDLDRLGETIVVRRAAAGERIVTLDGAERELISDDIVVADARRAVAVAGVMGGAATEVHEATTTVLIEAAYWDPPSILLTSKRLGLRSEASARFERGQDPNFCAQAADRVAQLLEDIAGGTAAPNINDEYPEVIEPRVIVLPAAEVSRVLGIDLDVDEIASLLRRFPFTVEGHDPLAVTVPTRRPDLVRPVDLVEEIARLYGYDNIPERVRTGLGGGLPVREQRIRKLRGVLNGAGYYETLNWSFARSEDAAALGEPSAADEPVRIVNPLRDEEGVLRTTLLPGLLRSGALNIARHNTGARLFEIGAVFLAGTGKLPEQPDRLAFIAAGVDADVFSATGLWELIADQMRLPDAATHPTARAGYHPGRAAAVTVAGVDVGVVGEVHPSVAETFGLSGRVAAGEIDIEPVLMERGSWQFELPSTYPPVIFDLAWAVPEEVTAAAVLEAIDDAAPGWLESRRVFDVFTGQSVGVGNKSLAVRLVLRAPDHTLTDEEVAPVRKAVASAVEAATGGRLRGDA